MYCELFCLCFYFLKENISKMDSKLEIHQRIDNFIKTRYMIVVFMIIIFCNIESIVF